MCWPTLLLPILSLTATTSHQYALDPGVRLVVPDSGWVTAGDGSKVQIVGVARGDRVMLRARRTMLLSRRVDSTSVTDTIVVESWAEFDGTRSATIEIDRTTPRRGSWTTADPLALFWSMRRVAPTNADELKRDRTTVALTLEARGSEPMRADLRLRATARPLVRRVVIGDRLVGAFAAPIGADNVPVVIALHGSEGGDTLSNLALATRFAARGYAAFAISYAAYSWNGGLPGVPGSFDSIDVETLDRARAWLGGQREADTSRTVLWGVSKGGEFAMVAAARRSWPRAVIGCVPSDVMWAGFGRAPNPGETLTSWADSGRRLPAIPYDNYDDVFAGRTTARAVHDRSRAAHPADAATARIPLENATAPLLLLGATDDDVWASGTMVQTLAKTRFAQPGRASVESHVYADAKHSICGVGTSPIATFGVDESRLAEGTARAAADAWTRTMTFLQRVVPIALAGGR